MRFVESTDNSQKYFSPNKVSQLLNNLCKKTFDNNWKLHNRHCVRVRNIVVAGFHLETFNITK